MQGWEPQPASWDLQEDRGQVLLPEAPALVWREGTIWGLARGADTEDFCLVQKPGFDLLGRGQEKRSRKDAKGVPQDIPSTLQISYITAMCSGP